MRGILTTAGWIAVSVLTAKGQVTVDKPEFEVASVKQAEAKDRGPMASFPGPLAEMMGFEGGPGSADPGRIRYRGVSLKILLARAYDLRPDQISGPGWLGSERYSIEATLPARTDAERLRLMLQKLLTERFQISLHRETKETLVYRLKIARGGPKLKPPEEVPHYRDEDERREALQKRAEANLAKVIAARESGIVEGQRPRVKGVLGN